VAFYDIPVLDKHPSLTGSWPFPFSCLLILCCCQELPSVRIIPVNSSLKFSVNDIRWGWPKQVYCGQVTSKPNAGTLSINHFVVVIQRDVALKDTPDSVLLNLCKMLNNSTLWSGKMSSERLTSEDWRDHH